MAQAEVLREFLVKVGYQSDRASEERFVRGLDNVTSLFGRLGVAAAAVAATVGAMTINMSRSLEGLYYSSRRVGSSADSIRAFGYAVSQMGGTSEEARSSLENLARAMRDNPGVRGMVQSIVGGNVNTQNGVETMRALGRAFRSMPYEIARLRASMLGIDERTLQAIMEGTDRFSARYTEMARRMGMNTQQSTQHAVQFQQAMRDLQLIGEFAIEKLVIALARIAPALVVGAERFLLWLERVIPKIDEFITNTVGWENALIALGAILTLHLLGPLRGVLATLTALVAFRLPAWLLRTLGIGAGTLGGAALLTMIPSAANANEREALERAQRGEDPFPDSPPLRPDGTPNPSPPGAYERIRDWLRNRSSGVGGSGTAPLDIYRRLEPNERQLGQQALEFFQQAGWSAAQAAGIVSYIEGESGFNSRAFNPAGGGNGAFGLAQWRGPRQVALGEFISRQRGVPTDFREATHAEQLAFINHEMTQGAERARGNMLRTATTPLAAADIVTRSYGRPAADEVDRLVRVRGQRAERWFGMTQPQAPGSGPGGVAAPVTINQRTEINVAPGSADPQSVASRVAEAQRDVNSDLVRNLQPGVR